MNRKEPQPKRYKEFVGIDVSKARLDSHLLNSSKAFKLGNDAALLDKFLTDQLKVFRET